MNARIPLVVDIARARDAVETARRNAAWALEHEPESARRKHIASHWARSLQYLGQAEATVAAGLRVRMTRALRYVTLAVTAVVAAWCMYALTGVQWLAIATGIVGSMAIMPTIVHRLVRWRFRRTTRHVDAVSFRTSGSSEATAARAALVAVAHVKSRINWHPWAGELSLWGNWRGSWSAQSLIDASWREAANAQQLVVDPYITTVHISLDSAEPSMQVSDAVLAQYRKLTPVTDSDSALAAGTDMAHATAYLDRAMCILADTTKGLGGNPHTPAAKHMWRTLVPLAVGTAVTVTVALVAAPASAVVAAPAAALAGQVCVDIIASVIHRFLPPRTVETEVERVLPVSDYADVSRIQGLWKTELTAIESSCEKILESIIDDPDDFYDRFERGDPDPDLPQWKRGVAVNLMLAMGCVSYAQDHITNWFGPSAE